MIWAQVLGGLVVSALVFYGLARRRPASSAWMVACVLSLAAIGTTIVGVQIPQPPEIWKGFVFPMFGLAVIISIEASLIARWLVAHRLRFATFLPAYIGMLGVAGALTMAVATAVYPGS